jgi:hypothetical protein
MSDLVGRLRRRIIVDGCEMPGNDALHREAADRIEALEVAMKYTGTELGKACEEIEQLKTDLQTSQEVVAEYIEDLERLWAALEKYADQSWWPEQLQSHDYLRKLASEALAAVEGKDDDT